jgi:integrase
VKEQEEVEPMGSVRKVKHRSGRESWQARWRDPAGIDRSKNFPRKVDANQHLVSLESDKLRGRYSDPRLARTRLADWFAEWQATRTNLSPQTRLRDEASIRNHVLPRFGTVPIGQIQPVHIAQWVADLDGSGLAPATTRKAYQLLAAGLSSAVDNGLIPVSPCRNVKLPKVTVSAMRILDPAETMALTDTIDERYRGMVLTAAYMGLRFGELAALRTERFDALRRTLRVEESLAEVRGEFIIKPPKSDASRRTVSVPSFIVEELARHLAVHGDDTGLIFSAPAGGPIRRTNFRRRIWVPAVRASVGEPCTFHDLRHTHAALLIAQGEHPKVIQERLGHASIKTTLDTYGHLFDGLDEAAADRLDEHWRAARVDAMWTHSDSGVIELPAK